MTIYAFTPQEPKMIQGPACTRCGISMHIIRIEPETPGFDRRTFECSLCHDTLSVVAPDR